jgi:hypothetical protein
MATYRLDPETYEFLRAKLLHLIIRGETVIGHFGRRGHVTGVLDGFVLSATLRDSRHNAQLTATFDKDFKTFTGQVVTTVNQEPQKRPCSGERLIRGR